MGEQRCTGQPETATSRCAVGCFTHAAWPADVPALKGGDTPFMLAAWMGHVEVCSFLVLEAGADPRHVNNWGCNAWHKACRMDGAASSVDMLRFLQQQEVDPCVVNCNGHSPLHKTALHGATAAAEFMRTETKCCGRGQVKAWRE